MFQQTGKHMKTKQSHIRKILGFLLVQKVTMQARDCGHSYLDVNCKSDPG